MASAAMNLAAFPPEVLENIFDKAINLHGCHGINSVLNDTEPTHAVLSDLTTAMNIMLTCKSWAATAWKLQLKVLPECIGNPIFQEIARRDAALEQIATNSVGDDPAEACSQHVPVWAGYCKYLQVVENNHTQQCMCKYVPGLIGGSPISCDVEHRIINNLPRFRAVSHLAIAGVFQPPGQWSKYIEIAQSLPKLKTLHLEWRRTEFDGLIEPNRGHCIRMLFGDYTGTSTIVALSLANFNVVHTHGMSQSRNQFSRIKELSLTDCWATASDLQKLMRCFERLEVLRFRSHRHATDYGDDEGFTALHEVLAPQKDSLHTLAFETNHLFNWDIDWSEMLALKCITYDVDEYRLSDNRDVIEEQLRGAKFNEIQMNFSWGDETYTFVRKFDQDDVNQIVAVARAAKHAQSATQAAAANGTAVSTSTGGLKIVVKFDNFINHTHRRFDGVFMDPALTGWNPADMPWDMLDRAQKDLKRYGITLVYVTPPGTRDEWVDIVLKIKDLFRIRGTLPMNDNHTLVDLLRAAELNDESLFGSTWATMHVRGQRMLQLDQRLQDQYNRIVQFYRRHG